VDQQPMAGKLSVLVLNYNYAHYLPECLEPLVRQTYQNMEIIVLDDCSTDNSVAVAQRYADDPRVRVVAHEQNAGFRRSLIEGTEELSSGEFLTVVSADDLVLRDDAFAIQVALLQKYPQAAFCFSSFDFIRPNGSDTHFSFPEETYREPEAAFKDIIACQGVWPPHSGTVIRKSEYDAVGGYRRDVVMPLDLALWFDLSAIGGFVYAPQTLHGYRLHGSQMTTSKTRANLREIAGLVRQACRDGERHGFKTRGMSRRAVGDHLGAFAIPEAFNGNRKVALTRWLAAAIECPYEALTSRRLWSTLVRSLLGNSGYSAARRAMHLWSAEPRA
jgi:glycosyltransferase involved in cell wall biosynthesis